MNIQDLIIHFEDAKALKHQLTECVICGKHEEQIWNDSYYKLPTCKGMGNECKKIWGSLGWDIQTHCREYFKALSDRLKYPSISELQEYSSALLFKNLSIRSLRGDDTNISTCHQEYPSNKAGHLGIVYQATNWIYTGLSAKRTNWTIEGVDLHCQTIADKYTSKEIRAKYGDKFSLVDRPRKHRYVYFNCNKYRKKELLNKLKYPVLSYPKRAGFVS